MYNNELKVIDPTPVELKKPNVIEATKQLYDVLVEIERSTSRLGTTMLGLPRADLCAGEPDCLHTNIFMALEMAITIHNELEVIHNSLGD